MPLHVSPPISTLSALWPQRKISQPDYAKLTTPPEAWVDLSTGSVGWGDCSPIPRLGIWAYMTSRV